MKPKTIVILLVVFIALLCTARFDSLRRARHAAPPDRIGSPVLPEFDAGDVAIVQFQSSDSTLTFEHKAKKWTLREKYGFPAKYDKLKDFVRDLADMRVGQVVQADKVTLHDMGLAPGTGTHVALENSDGETVTEVTIGSAYMKDAPEGMPPMMGDYPDGRFVSTGDGHFLVSKTLSGMPKGPIDWLETEILDVREPDVVELTVEGGDAPGFKLTRPEDGGSLEAEPIPEGHEPVRHAIDSLAGALAYLRFEDVIPISDAQRYMTNTVVCHFRTKEEIIYRVDVGAKFGKGRFVRLQASSANEDAKTVTSAEEFNKRAADWAFLVSKYNAG